jgi:hypothetical protein
MTEDKPQVVFVQLRAPRGDGDYGLVEEGFFRTVGDVVHLVTATGAPRFNKKGSPIQCAIGPGETARKVAWRLNRRSGFNRPLQYFNPGKI